MSKECQGAHSFPFGCSSETGQQIYKAHCLNVSKEGRSTHPLLACKGTQVLDPVLALASEEFQSCNFGIRSIFFLRGNLMLVMSFSVFSQ